MIDGFQAGLQATTQLGSARMGGDVSFLQMLSRQAIPQRKIGISGRSRLHYRADRRRG